MSKFYAEVVTRKLTDDSEVFSVRLYNTERYSLTNRTETIIIELHCDDARAAFKLAAILNVNIVDITLE